MSDLSPETAQPPSPNAGAKGHVREILSHRGFRRLLTSRIASQLADGFFQAGLAVSVFFNPNSQIEPMAYAIAFAMLAAPYSILGPYVGVFLDRWSRRNIIVVSNLIRATAMIPVALLIGTGGPEWAFASLALVAITINRFVLAGLSAAQPHVVATDNLVTANSFATTAGTMSFGAGLGASYVVIQAFTHLPGDARYAATIAVAVPLYALAAAVAWASFTRAGLGPDENERATGRILAAIVATTRGMINGFGHLWQRRGSAYVMGVQAGHRALYGILTVFTLAVFRGHFHDAASHPEFGDTLAWLAAIAAAGQVGSFLAALITPRLSRALGPGRWVTFLMIGMTAITAVLGLYIVELAFVVGVLLINIVSQGTKIVVDTSLQSNCADIFRGRLFSLNDTVFNLSFVVGLFAGASVIPSDGYAPWIVFVTAGGYALMCTWFAFASRRHAPYVRHASHPGSPAGQ